MAQYIDKDVVVAEIEKRIKKLETNILSAQKRNDANASKIMHLYIGCYNSILSFLYTLETKDPYEQCIQYASIEGGIKAHAETYSFNIESELFNQLTREQRKLWRKEIEQACISGGETGVELARDPRYKENFETKKGI